MGKNEQAWFIAERSRALALMHLTRRKDLVSTNAGRDVGLDCIVSIIKDEGEKSLRQFGVFLRGAKDPVTEEQLNQLLRPTMQALQRLGQFPERQQRRPGREGRRTWQISAGGAQGLRRASPFRRLGSRRSSAMRRNHVAMNDCTL